MVTVQVTHENGTLEASVDEDIKEFNAWFQARGNDPLVKGEVAILKTWLWWHLHVKEKSEPLQSTIPDHRDEPR